MTLRLVIEHSRHPQRRTEVRHLGGDLSIGRGADCDWAIDDPDMFISRRHCVISGQDEQFLVTDASRGGLFVDGASQPLGAGNSAPLEHGTRLRLGDVVIRIEVENSRATADASAGAHPADDFFSRAPEPHVAPPRPESLPEPFETGRPATHGTATPPARPSSAGFDDPFTLDPPSSSAGANSAHRPSARLSAGDFWSDSGPAVPTSPPRQTTGFDSDALFAATDAASPAVQSVPAAPVPPPRPSDEPTRSAPAAASTPLPDAAAPPPVAASQPDSFFDAFLRGTGLDPSDLRLAGTEAEAEAIGRRFRLLAEGLVILLRARAREKGGARLAQTVIGATDVNPLKFLPTSDEALAALITPRGKGYLAPEEAISLAFRDITDHQMRNWIAIQSALRHMIDRFDPAAFEATVDSEGMMKALLAGGKGAKLWQLYTERYREIAKAAEDRFLGEVGADFREAYESNGKQQREDER